MEQGHRPQRKTLWLSGLDDNKEKEEMTDSCFSEDLCGNQDWKILFGDINIYVMFPAHQNDPYIGLLGL